MEILVLYPAKDQSLLSETHRLFLNACPEKDASAPNIYETHVDFGPGDTSVTFVTTAKDLHLYLGLMGMNAQLFFAQLLKESFKKNNSSTLLVRARAGERKGVLVTQVTANITMIFHLSPAH